MSVAKRKKTLDGRSGTVTDLEDEDVEVGSLLIGDTTQSTSTITGALQCRGGVGISKNLNVDGNLNVTGTFAVASLNASSTADSSSTSTGAIVTAGGIGAAKNITSLTNITTGTTDSSSISTGTIITAGGIGVAKNVTSAGVLKTTLSTDASSTTTGSIITSGGVGIAKTLYCLDAKVTDSTTSSSTSTGALVVTGGLGVGGNLNVGGTFGVSTLNVTSSTNATSTSTGSLYTSGGVGVTKDIYLGGLLAPDVQYITRPTSGTTTANIGLKSLTVLIGGSGSNFGGSVVLTLPDVSSYTYYGQTFRLMGFAADDESSGIGDTNYLGNQPVTVNVYDSATTILRFTGENVATSFVLDAMNFDVTFTYMPYYSGVQYNQWHVNITNCATTLKYMRFTGCWTYASAIKTLVGFTRQGNVVGVRIDTLLPPSGSTSYIDGTYATTNKIVVPQIFRPYLRDAVMGITMINNNSWSAECELTIGTTGTFRMSSHYNSTVTGNLGWNTISVSYSII